MKRKVISADEYLKQLLKRKKQKLEALKAQQRIDSEIYKTKLESLILDINELEEHIDNVDVPVEYEGEIVKVVKK